MGPFSVFYKNERQLPYRTLWQDTGNIPDRSEAVARDAPCILVPEHKFMKQHYAKEST